MERFQFYMTSGQRLTLETLAKARHQEMAELVREAIDRTYRTGRNTEAFSQALGETFGMLRKRSSIRSGIAYQDRMRRLWKRKRAS